MQVNIKLDVSTLSPGLFAAPPEQEALNKYAADMEAWEKSDQSTPQPTPPPNGSITPEEFAARLLIRAIKEQHKEGNTSQLRHIIKLCKGIEDDYKSGVLNFTENDLIYVRKSFSKVDNWPTQPEDLVKFILMVEDALQPKGK